MKPVCLSQVHQRLLHLTSGLRFCYLALRFITTGVKQSGLCYCYCFGLQNVLLQIAWHFVFVSTKNQSAEKTCLKSYIYVQCRLSVHSLFFAMLKCENQLPPICAVLLATVVDNSQIAVCVTVFPCFSSDIFTSF